MLKCRRLLNKLIRWKTSRERGTCSKWLCSWLKFGALGFISPCVTKISQFTCVLLYSLLLDFILAPCPHWPDEKTLVIPWNWQNYIFLNVVSWTFAKVHFPPGRQVKNRLIPGVIHKFRSQTFHWDFPIKGFFFIFIWHQPQVPSSQVLFQWGVSGCSSCWCCRVFWVLQQLRFWLEGDVFKASEGTRAPGQRKQYSSLLPRVFLNPSSSPFLLLYPRNRKINPNPRPRVSHSLWLPLCAQAFAAMWDV